MPMIAFIGVRISWLMFARNIDFARVAASAAAARVLELERHLDALLDVLLDRGRHVVERFRHGVQLGDRFPRVDRVV